MTEVNSKLEVEDVGRITVVRIIDRSIRDEITIQHVVNQLVDLVEVERRKDLIVDFSNVQYLSSAVLSHLVKLEKRVKEIGGQLYLCGLQENVREVFTITRMNRFFQICPDRASALTSF